MRINDKKIFFIAVWVLILAGGMHLLWAYENEPAPHASGAEHFHLPPGQNLHATKPTIIMFAHPHCPCSRASVAELTKIISQHPEAFQVKVLFYRPEEKSQEWVHSSLWTAAGKIPYTERSIDEKGVTARRFQAGTSGEIFVVDPGGRLLFHGGLTPSRGHEGPSVGKASLQEIAQGKKASILQGPVFGCSLFRAQTLAGEI